MKNFEILITRRNGKTISNHDKIEGDSLIEVLSKLPLTIAKIQEDIHDEELSSLRGMNDDIPF